MRSLDAQADAAFTLCRGAGSGGPRSFEVSAAGAPTQPPKVLVMDGCVSYAAALAPFWVRAGAR